MTPSRTVPIQTDTQQSQSPIYSETPTGTVTPTLFPSNTPVPPTSTPTPLAGTAGQKCPSIQFVNQVPDSLAHGTLVLREKGIESYLLVNLEDGSQRLFPEGNNHLVDSGVVSPSRTWFAFDEATFANSVYDYSETPNVLLSEEIIVVSSDGAVVLTIPKQERWRSLEDQWANSEMLLIGRSSPFLVRFNPFTLFWDEFSIDAPNRYYDDYDYQKLALNSVYDLLVYLHKDLKLLNIWDWRSKTIVAEVPFRNTYWHIHEYMDSGPQWSPDGEQFVIIGQQEGKTAPDYPAGQVYLVSRAGDVRQLSNFPEETGSPYGLGLYSWSPDGTKIAIWVNFEPKSDTLEELVIIDVLTGETVRYCVLNDIEITAPIDVRRLYAGDTRIAPIWSPDSQAIMVQSGRAGGETRITLINLVDNVAVRLDFNARPVGWMTEGE